MRPPHSIKAVIFGATGMVGEGVLHEALKDESVEAVLAVGRRPCEVIHPKLTEILHTDFYDYTSLRTALTGFNACFFCLGVTSVGKSEELYRRLTYDLTLAAATALSASNPDMVFCYVSGQGTDSREQGRLMWARVKGRTENDLQKLPFKSVYLFRPGMIQPMPGMKHTLPIVKPFAPLFPLLKFFFPASVCTLEDVGRAMVRVTTAGYEKRILETPDITLLGRKRFTQ